MRSIDESESACLVPCPTVDLLRLITTVADRDCSKQLHQLLRTNPALLLFALNEHRLDCQFAPRSATKLVAWCRSNLVPAIGSCVLSDLKRGDVPLESEFPRRRQLDEFFADFLRCRNHKKIRKSLRRFLQMFAGAKKSEAKHWVSAVLGSGIRADQFKCKRVRREETRAQVIDVWRSQPEFPFDVEALIDLGVAQLENEQLFERRLLEEKLASMKQLAYGASHEINNPLANVATRAQTMLTTESDPDKRHKLAVIYEQAIRAHEMISDMMLFAHPPALQRQTLSLRLLMARISKELEPLLTKVPIEFRMIMGPNVDRANLDATQFLVAIKALVCNSIESLSAPPNVTAERTQQIVLRLDSSLNGDLVVEVADDGQTIERGVARHMFDPFYSGREAGRGLGFGLSKAWTIAKLHHGSLSYQAIRGTGNRFILRIADANPSVKSVSVSACSTIAICNSQGKIEGEAA
ncbi:MAG: signal transduction histidine kinase [Mariniblastus sp.]|jgi:signal transduction histidine kinase